jgi:hypothetical protein
MATPDSPASVSLLLLPRELLEKIFVLCSLEDVLAARLATRRLRLLGAVFIQKARVPVPYWLEELQQLLVRPSCCKSSIARAQARSGGRTLTTSHLSCRTSSRWPPA